MWGWRKTTQLQLRKPTGMSRERALKALTVVGLTVSLASLNASAGGGFRDIFVEADGERLTTALWYPTEVPSGQMTLGPFSMTATPGAPAAATASRLGRASTDQLAVSCTAGRYPASMAAMVDRGVNTLTVPEGLANDAQ